MNHPNHATLDDTAMQAVMTALRACYGNLDEPDFRKVVRILENDPYRPLIELLRSNGIETNDKTDLNDDVAIHLSLRQSGHHLGLALSGVGPYASLLRQDAAERYSWVTQPKSAPTPLAAQVAQAVQATGFKSLDRDFANRKIKMTWYDGSEEVILYQALFSDRDQAP